VAGRTIATVEVHHPRAIRRHLPGDAHFVAMLPAHDPGRVPARQVPVAAARLRRRDHRPPRHERPAADAAGRRPDETHLRVRFTFTDGGPSCASSTSARSAACRSPSGGAELPAEIAHIARDPIDPLFDDEAFVAGCAAAHRGQAALLDQT
jgi:formamidopyrimidine-DNA glycosylase